MRRLPEEILRIGHCAPCAVAGFTLVEVLVAVTVLSLILVALLGGLRFASQVSAATEARFDDLTEMEAVQGFMRDAVSRAYPAIASRSGRPARIAFEGEAESLRFVGQMPAQTGRGGLYEMDFTLAGEGDRKQLNVGWRLYRSGPLQLGGSAFDGQATLIEDAADVTFGYFGARNRGEPRQWYADWKDTDRLPALVRIHAAFAGRADRTWPDIVVAPALGLGQK